MKKTLSEFKKFILRGNVVDLAVAVVIGASFNSIVQALVKDIITPFIGIFYKQQQFGEAYFSIQGSKFMYGDFINAITSFVIIAAVVFFLVMQPLNRLVAYSNRNKKPEDPSSQKCPECLSEIPKAATRCKFCTTKLSPAKAEK